MKAIIAASLALFSSMVFGSEESVMKCQMSILRVESGNMSGAPRPVSDVILTADTNQFYAVVGGGRIISSPALSEHKGDMAAYHSGAAYFIRKGSYFVIYDDFGYVFDQCVKVE